MNLERFLGKLFTSWQVIQNKIHPSYAQAGEDQVIRYLLHSLRISNPTYLDIGTNHPYLGNNTFYFYTRGSKGVCVEPNIAFEKSIRKHRKRDILILAGVGLNNEKEADYYVFPEQYSAWNTFSKDEAIKRQTESGVSYTQKVKTPLVNINDIMVKHFHPHPNIVSIDVEGLDLEILKSLDFEKHRPEIFCVESVNFSVTHSASKNNELNEFLESKGYFIFADTFINTLFCRKDAFNKL